MSIEEKFDALVEGLPLDEGPGVAIGVIRDGQFIHRKAYGLADLEWRQALRPDCSFRIASLSKQFTAAAIMRLSEQGALSLDDPLERYLPSFDPRGRDVTLTHLLNHTSGIRNHDQGRGPRTERSNIPRDKLIEDIYAAPFDFEPGEKYRYCNSGYILLGAVIEAVSGLTYEGFLQTTFFEPLGMTRTGLCFAETIIPLRARGYVRGRSGYHNARPDPTNWSHSAGGLCSTLDDLAIWDAALRDGTALTDDSFEAMLRPTPLADGSLYPYGFGWGLADYGGHPLRHHTGGVSGFACQMASLIHKSLTTIVLSNLYLFPFDRVTRGLLRVALGLPPVTVDHHPLPPPAFAWIAGRYRAEDGGEVVIGPGALDPKDLASLGDALFCHPSDLEVTFQFRDLQGERYGALVYTSPLWPTGIFTRV